MNKKVAIQGGFGAFHEIAAKQFFEEELEIVPCETFIDVFESLCKKEVDFATVAIENTIAGSLLTNYSLLRESGMGIVGETNLHITQNLMALPGQSIQDITEVYSHPIAIQQSRVFFKDYPNMKLIESVDTALSAKDIKDKNLKGAAAIGSTLAAEMYGLEILESGIETNKKNFTRFLIIGNEQDLESKGLFKKDVVNKSSLCFSLPHEEGSLSSVLAILAFYKISLTKIQSVPIVGYEFEYFFYIDLYFENLEKYRQSITAISPLIKNLKILGEYKKAPVLLTEERELLNEENKNSK